jgi:hypothetical protein
VFLHFHNNSSRISVRIELSLFENEQCVEEESGRKILNRKLLGAQRVTSTLLFDAPAFFRSWRGTAAFS